MDDEEPGVPGRETGVPTEPGDRDGDGDGDGPSAAPPAHGTVVLSRAQGGYRDALRGYAVFIDESQVGSIRRGQTLRFEVPPGAHQLQLKIAWFTSRPLNALVDEGGTVCFICSPGGDASSALSDVSAATGDYITLRQTAEPIVMAKTPMGRDTRLLLGTAFGFLAGSITLVGALIWHYTGVAPTADNAVAATGLAVTLASMVAFRLRRRKARQHPRT